MNIEKEGILRYSFMGRPIPARLRRRRLPAGPELMGDAGAAHPKKGTVPAPPMEPMLALRQYHCNH